VANRKATKNGPPTRNAMNAVKKATSSWTIPSSRKRRQTATENDDAINTDTKKQAAVKKKKDKHKKAKISFMQKWQR
jgi:hypothetical protein